MTATRAAQMRVRVLLSIQRALLGSVTPSLRGVAVSWDERRVSARFVYDVDDSTHAELVQEIETEVLADLDPELSTQFEIEAASGSTPRVLKGAEIWAYLRREA